MEMIHHESLGPVAILKKKFRKQLIFLPILICITALLFLTDLNNAEKVWFLISIVACLAQLFDVYVNYKLTSGLERMDRPVKTNLERYISRIEKSLKWQHKAGMGLLVLMYLFIEVAMRFHNGELLDDWRAIDPFIRLGAYALSFVALHFSSRFVRRRDFDQHIGRLKKLLTEFS
jgi:hypothetical protein